MPQGDIIKDLVENLRMDMSQSPHNQIAHPIICQSAPSLSEDMTHAHNGHGLLEALLQRLGISRNRLIVLPHPQQVIMGLVLNTLANRTCTDIPLTQIRHCTDNYLRCPLSISQ